MIEVPIAPPASRSLPTRLVLLSLAVVASVFVLSSHNDTPLPSSLTASASAASVCDAPARRQLAATGGDSSAWRALGRCMAADAREAILFLHVSKSGGTGLCSLAQLEHCTIDGNQREVGANAIYGNCWAPELDDGPHWLTYYPDAAFHTDFDNMPSTRAASGVATCAGRRDWAAAHGSNFMMDENFYSDDMVAERACSAYFVGTMLFRAPIERIYSHFRELVTTNQARRPGCTRCRIIQHRGARESPSQWRPHAIPMRHEARRQGLLQRRAGAVE